ncbi:hypothetical protein OIU79_016952 [Salix purpurea]|uniref:Uncharacterized protein n=1 Tax=Salix purpurea TaxID=77065 RepID=A0A9Q0WTV7_SALPP|nr:hypothetical protein OIU79_016952 [Salix purpurea]
MFTREYNPRFTYIIHNNKDTKNNSKGIVCSNHPCNDVLLLEFLVGQTETTPCKQERETAVSLQ